eukprot:137595-Pyramimonas_sp.AAC.1
MGRAKVPRKSPTTKGSPIVPPSPVLVYIPLHGPWTDHAASEALNTQQNILRFCMELYRLAQFSPVPAGESVGPVLKCKRERTSSEPKAPAEELCD